MSKIATVAVASLKELWSLLVDDGFLAIAALVAIGVGFLVSRDSVLGSVDAVGWILISIIVASLFVSLRRAIAAYNRAQV